MSSRKNSFVPVKECYLLNSEPKHNIKHQKAFIWPKPSEGHEFTCINLDLITTISKFLSAFDAVLHCNVPFQVKWGVYGLKRDYFTRHKNLNNEIICEKHYFDVCQFLIKLNQHDKQMIFYEIQAKFQHYDLFRNLSYTDFSRGFGFLTYMIVFFEQWKNNLQGAFSVEFKFIENTKMVNVSFSNEEYDDINKVCKWFYPIYFRFATMLPSALKKFVDVYNLYKNNPPLCMYKKMYNVENLDNSKNEHYETTKNEHYETTKDETNRIPMTQNDVVKNYNKVMTDFYDRGDDFDPNVDSIGLNNPADDTNNKNDSSGFMQPPKMRIKKPKPSEDNFVIKKSKLEFDVVSTLTQLIDN